jgi:hypothetical protein
MAQASAFSAELMNKLETETKFIEAASKAVSPFARFPGPDGKYYAKLQRILWTIDKKSGCFKVTLTVMTLAFVESGSSEFKGSIARFSKVIKDGTKENKQDAWDRVFTTIYQPLGYPTASWGHHTKERLIAATDELNSTRPALLINIRTGEDKRYYNLDIMEVLKDEAIAHLLGDTMELTDDQYALLEAADEETHAAEESVVADAKTAIENAAKQMETLQDVAQAVQFVLQGQPDMYNEAMLAKFDLPKLRTILLCTYIQKMGHTPEEFGYKFPEVPAVDLSAYGVQGNGQDALHSATQKAPFEADAGNQLQAMLQQQSVVEEDDEEVPGDPVGSSRPDKIEAFVRTLERMQILVMIRNMVPESKFAKAIDTEVYRSQLVELLLADPSAPLVAPVVA